MTKSIDNNELNSNYQNHEFATEYDKYFAGGHNSIYRTRFGNKAVIPRERNLIYKTFLKAMADFSGKVFKVVDFGCGDGRLFSTLENLDKYCNIKNINLEIICFDPSLAGLETMLDALLLTGYSAVQNEEDSLRFDKSGYIKSILKKDNITVKLIHGNAQDNFSHTKELLGNDLNLVLLMFGVLSHIVTRVKRQETLKMFKHNMASNSYIISNVPTKKLFKNYLDCYDKYRKNKDFASLNHATEEGDIYYTRNNDAQQISNYYHIYNQKELIEDLSIAGFDITKNGTSSITHTPLLSKKNNIAIYLDSFLSIVISKKIFPYSWTEMLGSYIFAVAKIK